MLSYFSLLINNITSVYPRKLARQPQLSTQLHWNAFRPPISSLYNSSRYCTMESGYLTAKIDPGGSELVRRPKSTPVASQDLSDYDAKMTWVRSTLSDILQSRLKFSDSPIIDCDQRILSLHPRRQSRATWCTNDLYLLLVGV